jgi:predicted negative regulator of RcsB-dependent stress response
LNATEQYDLALRELRKALLIFETNLGKDHEATARTLHHMGDAFAGKKDTTGALIQYGKAFSIQVARLGRHNPQTLETFRKLDHHMRKPGDD